MLGAAALPETRVSGPPPAGRGGDAWLAESSAGSSGVPPFAADPLRPPGLTQGVEKDAAASKSAGGGLAGLRESGEGEDDASASRTARVGVVGLGVGGAGGGGGAASGTAGGKLRGLTADGEGEEDGAGSGTAGGGVGGGGGEGEEDAAELRAGSGLEIGPAWSPPAPPEPALRESLMSRRLAFRDAAADGRVARALKVLTCECPTGVSGQVVDGRPQKPSGIHLTSSLLVIWYQCDLVFRAIERHKAVGPTPKGFLEDPTTLWRTLTKLS